MGYKIDMEGTRGERETSGMWDEGYPRPVDLFRPGPVADQLALGSRVVGTWSFSPGRDVPGPPLPHAARGEKFWGAPPPAPLSPPLTSGKPGGIKRWSCDQTRDLTDQLTPRPAWPGLAWHGPGPVDLWVGLGHHRVADQLTPYPDNPPTS